MKFRFVADDKALVGVRFPFWYGVAYRVYHKRQTVFYIIPFNLVVRYSYGFYWVVYWWLHKGTWHTELDNAYWRGWNDAQQERDRGDYRTAQIIKSASDSKSR